MAERISIIVPTVNRATLARTLASIDAERRAGDEVLVIGPPETPVPAWCRRFDTPADSTPKKWGGPERRLGIAHATGDYLAFLDDDDVYLPGWRAAMAEAAQAFPQRPVIFRMQDAATGKRWWRDGEPYLQNGNFGSPCIFMPNVAEKLGTWTDHFEGDFRFVNGMWWSKYPKRHTRARPSVVFQPQVIALLRPHA